MIHDHKETKSTGSKYRGTFYSLGFDWIMNSLVMTLPVDTIFLYINICSLSKENNKITF